MKLYKSDVVVETHNRPRLPLFSAGLGTRWGTCDRPHRVRKDASSWRTTRNWVALLTIEAMGEGLIHRRAARSAAKVPGRYLGGLANIQTALDII